MVGGPREVVGAGACLTCAPLSVQPGGQRHLVVHYLEGIRQCGDPWQGECALLPSPWVVTAPWSGPHGQCLWWTQGADAQVSCCLGASSRPGSVSRGLGLGGRAVTEAWLQGLVTTLHEGDDFGQLALVNDAPRAATIVLREDNCHFLRVDKQDFNRIIKVLWRGVGRAGGKEGSLEKCGAGEGPERACEGQERGDGEAWR